MISYTEADSILRPHRGRTLAAWLCPRKEEVILIFSDGGICISASEKGVLDLCAVGNEELEKVCKAENEEKFKLKDAVDYVAEWKRNR